MLEPISITDESKDKNKEVKVWEPTDDEQSRKLYFDTLFTTVLIPYRQQFEQVWRDAYDIHDQIVDAEYDDGRTNIVLPLSTMLIETKLAEELENKPDLYFEATSEDDVPKVPILEDIIKRHVWEKSYMDDRLYEAFFEKNLYGQSWLSPQFVKKRKMMKEGYLEKGEMKYKEREVTYENDIYVKLYHNDEVWVEPCRDLRDAGYCVLKDSYGSRDAFIDDYSEDIYKNLDYVQPGKWYYAEDQKIANTPANLIDVSNKQKVTVLHYYNKFKDEYCIWANGVEIYFGKMPYDHGELPLVQFINRYRPDSLYHKGETELCAGLFALLNAIFNTSIDALKYAISPLLVIPTGSNFNSDEIVARPGLVIKANMDGFKQLELGRIPNEAISLRETLLDFISWSTGVNIRQMVGEPTSTTATVAALRKESLSRRINLGLRLNEARAFKRLGEQLIKLVQQYYTEPMIARIVDESKIDDAANEVEEKPKDPQYRNIKVRGKSFKETNTNGKKGLEVEKVDKNEYGFFQARPEFILTKTDLDVMCRPGSTVAVSQLLEQSKAEKALNLFPLVQPLLQQEQNQLNATFFVKKWLDSMKYDDEKAFGKEETDEESVDQIMQEQDMGKINPLSVKMQPTAPAVPTQGGAAPMPAANGAPSAPVPRTPEGQSGAVTMASQMGQAVDLGLGE